MIDGVVPKDWLDGCVAGHRRLETLLAATLTDEAAAAPCRLEGWTVGHLVTHIARNADAHTWVVEAAGRGEVVPMYPGGPASREAGIDQGAGRPADQLVSDVLASHQRLERAWADASHEVWTQGLGVRNAGRTTISDFVFLRWREVEVHRADLGLPDPDHAGSDPWDVLPPTYLDRELGEMTAGLPGRLPEGVTVVLVPGDRPSRAYGQGDRIVYLHGTAGRLLCWLMDRGGDPAWPTLRSWSY
jgi:maleylpyruvate isomerase